jgi:hypothetical protein
MKKRNVEARRLGAYERLKESKFFPKTNAAGHERTQEKWQARKDKELEILKKRCNV